MQQAQYLEKNKDGIVENTKLPKCSFPFHWYFTPLSVSARQAEHTVLQ